MGLLKRKRAYAGTRIQTRASLDAVKIHGPNSPRVLNGEIPEGFEEPIQSQEERVVVMTYEDVVEKFGKKDADAIFTKHADEGRLIQEDHGN